MPNHRNENGDLVYRTQDDKPVVFRQIGWQVNGGPNDGLFVPLDQQVPRDEPIGGFSPVYIEIGD